MQQSPINNSFLARLGDAMFRRRRLVVAVWALGLVLAFAASSKLAGEWSADYETPGSDSKAAAEVLDERFEERRPYSVDFVWQARDVTEARSAAGSTTCWPRLSARRASATA